VIPGCDVRVTNMCEFTMPAQPELLPLRQSVVLKITHENYIKKEYFESFDSSIIEILLTCDIGMRFLFRFFDTFFP